MRFQIPTIVMTLYALTAGVSAGQFDTVSLAQRSAVYERWLDTHAADAVERSIEKRNKHGAKPLANHITDNIHRIMAGKVLHVNGGDCEIVNFARHVGPGEWSVPCRNGHNVIISATGYWRWERGEVMPMPPKWI